MLKKLLNKITNIFVSRNALQIEKYLSKSSDLVDLEERMRELDRNGVYNKFYT